MTRYRAAPPDHVAPLVAAVQQLRDDAGADLRDVLDRCGVRGDARLSLARVVYASGGSVATAPVAAFSFWNS